jgi:hypothetical protein
VATAAENRLSIRRNSKKSFPAASDCRKQSRFMPPAVDQAPRAICGAVAIAVSDHSATLAGPASSAHHREHHEHRSDERRALIAQPVFATGNRVTFGGRSAGRSSGGAGLPSFARTNRTSLALNHPGAGGAVAARTAAAATPDGHALRRAAAGGAICYCAPKQA